MNKREQRSVAGPVLVTMIPMLLLSAPVLAEDVVAIEVPEPGVMALFTAVFAVAGLVYRNRRK